MAHEEFPREDELESRQAAGLYPVGRALRQTFDAENHDSLGTDLTGLMLELARIEPDAGPLPRGRVPGAPALPAAPAPRALSAPTSWWRAALDRRRAR